MPRLIKSLITQKNRKKNTKKQKQGKDVLGLIPFLLAPSLLLSHIFVTPLILCSFISLLTCPMSFFDLHIISFFPALTSVLLLSVYVSNLFHLPFSFLLHFLPSPTSACPQKYLPHPLSLPMQDTTKEKKRFFQPYGLGLLDYKSILTPICCIFHRVNS